MEPAPTYVAAAQLICITLVAVVLFVVFSLTADNFFTSGNIVNILRLVSFTAIAGVGMTYLFIAGEFDISIGSTFGLAAVLMTWLVAEHGMAVPQPAWRSSRCSDRARERRLVTTGRRALAHRYPRHAQPRPRCGAGADRRDPAGVPDRA